MPKDVFDEALLAIAKLEGKTVEQVKAEMAAEMLRSRLAGSVRAPLARTEVGDASRIPRGEAIARHRAQDFPGTPVVRYRDDRESPEDARERWLEEESELVDGVHGLGGQTAGGIFGGGEIATDVYDPAAEHRAEGRAARGASMAVSGRMLRVLESLEERLNGVLPAAPRGPRRLR